MKPRADSRTGFTLVELLVVTGIIALIVAVALPVFHSAWERGRQAACMTNLRQIMMAFRMYVEDYDLWPPYLYQTHTKRPYPPIFVYQWNDLLAPYGTDRLRCPSVAHVPMDIQAWFSGYGYNMMLPGLPEAAIRYPSTTIVALDSHTRALAGTEADWSTPDPPGVTRHNGSETMALPTGM